MISKEETEHIAKLARLGLDEDEIKKYQKDLSSILDYIEKLKEVDVEGIKPFTHSDALANVTRKDVKNKRTREQIDKLIKLMPESKDGYLKVKSVFE
jgi:aspartyl-tRNA(Asn)/glutamyl-tRNA(Gln) amidotransferase subunit C